MKAGVKTYEFYDFNGNLLVEFTPALSNRLVEHIYLGGKRIATIGPAPTSIALPAQTLTAVAGRTVSFVATVSGGVSPTGTVAFTDGATPLSSIGLAGGAATLTTTFTTVGPHSLTATYSGDSANFGTAVTAIVNVLSATTISGPAGGGALSTVVGKAAPLSATINGISPTGTVSFYDGAVLLGTTALIGGTATITPTFMTTGDHTIRFVYSGDSRNALSSATVTLKVLMRPELLIPILDLLLN